MIKIKKSSSFWIALFFNTLFLPMAAFADNKNVPAHDCSPKAYDAVVSHPNLNVLKKLNIQNLDSSKDIIADNFIWHYFNPRLPALHGDYHGIEGFKEFFKKLHIISNGSFQAKTISRTLVGDELVIIQTCNRLALEEFGGNTIETKVVVVWRIVDGKITEGFDIPSIYKVKIIE